MRIDCDLLVAGSGAAGLAAAVTAARRGLKVIVAEKARVLGGTTAWSGGWIYAPRNPLAVRAGIVEDIDAPRTYLREVAGPWFDAERVEAFLHGAPRMVDFFERETALQFESGNTIPDTYGHVPGAGMGGRSVIAAPYNARELGVLAARVRLPLRETTFMGLTIQAGPDLRAFMNVTRSPRAFAHVSWRVGRHLADLALRGRAAQLRNGSALVARLVRSAADNGVTFYTSVHVARLLHGPEGVRGGVLATLEGEADVVTTRGVLLATGGFPHDPQRRAALFPANDHHLTLAVPTAAGDGLRMGEAAGGSVDLTLASPGAWCPVSEVPFPDGTTGRFPHIIERGKPGVIAVRANGERFCNEGHGYHDYVEALLAATPKGEEPASWLVCTHAFLRRYGLGYVRPAPLPIGRHLRNGYLKRGSTIEELARACGIDADGLARTVTYYNEHARRGEDPAFGRGSTVYNRYQGDARVQPNPSVAPLAPGPFYAVKVLPGSFGTFMGLRTDAHARVLDAQGAPIPGLFAAGADMASVFGGMYPAGGINLGPALTFGFLAGEYAAAHPLV